MSETVLRLLKKLKNEHPGYLTINLDFIAKEIIKETNKKFYIDNIHDIEKSYATVFSETKVRSFPDESNLDKLLAEIEDTREKTYFEKQVEDDKAKEEINRRFFVGIKEAQEKRKEELKLSNEKPYIVNAISECEVELDKSIVKHIEDFKIFCQWYIQRKGVEEFEDDFYDIKTYFSHDSFDFFSTVVIVGDGCRYNHSHHHIKLYENLKEKMKERASKERALYIENHAKLNYLKRKWFGQ